MMWQQDPEYPENLGLQAFTASNLNLWRAFVTKGLSPEKFNSAINEALKNGKFHKQVKSADPTLLPFSLLRVQTGEDRFSLVIPTPMQLISTDPSVKIKIAFIVETNEADDHYVIGPEPVALYIKKYNDAVPASVLPIVEQMYAMPTEGYTQRSSQQFYKEYWVASLNNLSYGENLADFMRTWIISSRADLTLNIKQRLKLSLAIIAELKKWHAQGWIHGNLQAKNIQVVRHCNDIYEVKIINWQNSPSLQQSWTPPSNSAERGDYYLNQTARLLSVPEMDIYKLGIILTELVIRNNNPVESLKGYPSPKGLCDPLIKILKSMIAPEPANRPSLTTAATVFYEALQQVEGRFFASSCPRITPTAILMEEITIPKIALN